HAFHAQALEDDGLLRRAWPDRDPLALEVLDGIDARTDTGNNRHASVIGIGNNAHRLVGAGAKQERRDAMDAGIDGAAEDRVLAGGWAFERNDLHLVAGGDELLVVVDGDAVNELERPHPQHLVLSLRLGRGQDEPERGGEDKQQPWQRPESVWHGD